jgi:hypothetical protein
MVSKVEEKFLTPAPTINEAAFKVLCEVLELDDEEQQIARLVISTYETAKERHDGRH